MESLDVAAPASVTVQPRVIRRKITPPPLPSTVVRRPRIEALLARLIEQHKVTCVYASAGAGKTTAVLQAAESLNRPLAWLGVDTTDIATGRLLTYLEASLSVHAPSVEGVATAALAAMLPHAEVAGLLAEAVGDTPILLVLDDVERLEPEPEALSVVAMFARYLPPTARLVVVSRSELALTTSGASLSLLAAVGEEDLAFTVREAEQALAVAGRPEIDPVEALVETGGWVTGVMFEAWRSSDHVIGIGGESDPLHGYLAVQILGQMDPQERDFLVTTSVLDEVTVQAAEALGIADAAARLHALRGRRLPVSWEAEGRAMRSHPRFREYLLEVLGRRGEKEVQQLRRAYARLLAGQGHDEEAVEEFLAGGSPEEALPIVDRVIPLVIERTDFALAERWLERLGPVRTDDEPGLVTGELMLAVALEDYGRGVRLAERLAAAGRRDALARQSGRACALMAWCYLHGGQVDQIAHVLTLAPDGSDTRAVRYAMGVVSDGEAVLNPADMVPTGSPLDALVLRTHHDRGRLKLLTKPLAMPWAAQAALPWRVNALLSSGHIEQAFELFQGAQGQSDNGVWLPAILGPRLMCELGEAETAWRLLREGRPRVEASGSQMFMVFSLLAEAELTLELDEDPARALAVLQQVDANPVGSGYLFLAEHADVLRGLALLIAGEDAQARRVLGTTVCSMERGDRLLLLPAAAVYLAEAHWRAGDEDAADAAADRALAAAEEHGSNHILLRSLARFPGVLSRRLDSERGALSPWHDVGRALHARGTQVADVLAGSVHLVEFGRVAVVVNRTEVQPRLKKSYELLAYLANGGRDVVRRTEVMEALFEGRSDDSAASYLRQAVLRLRKAVPDLLETDAGAGRIRLSESVHVTTESERTVGLLRQAASLRGPERLSMLLEALEIVDRGEYLPGMVAVWVDERREQIAALARDARYEAAEIAFSTDDFGQAERLATQVLDADPYRESAWRLLMRTAHAVGDHDRVIGVYRACERA
ncbi:MAG: BTAD domain-containing putative transcriptional regulator, partial [Actinomycetes bacterium]